MLSKSCKLSWLFSSLALCLFTSACAPKADDGLSDVERRAVAFTLNDLLEKIQEEAGQVEGEEVFVRLVREWQDAQGHTCPSKEQYKELVKKQTSSGFLLSVSELEVSSQSQGLGEGENEDEDSEDKQMLLAFYQDLQKRAAVYQDLQKRVAVAGVLSQALAKGCGFNPEWLFREVSYEVKNEICRKFVEQDGQDPDLLLQMRDSGLCPVRM